MLRLFYYRPVNIFYWKNIKPKQVITKKQTNKQKQKQKQRNKQANSFVIFCFHSDYQKLKRILDLNNFSMTFEWSMSPKRS